MMLQSRCISANKYSALQPSPCCNPFKKERKNIFLFRGKFAAILSRKKERKYIFLFGGRFAALQAFQERKNENIFFWFGGKHAVESR